MDFTELPAAETYANPPDTPEEVAFADEELEDNQALAIVLADVEIAEKFLLSKNLTTSLDQADDLYRATVRTRAWANGKPRSSLGMPVVLEAIERILPTLYLSLFGSGKEPFTLTPTGKTKPAAARAKGKVLEWAIKQSDLKEEMRRSLKTCLQYGFVVGTWGWESCEKRIKSYRRKDDGSVESSTEIININQPTYECLDLRQTLVDPGCKTQNVRKGAKYIIKQVFTTADGLDELREDPAYKNIPTREELARILTSRTAATDSLQAQKTNVWHEYQAAPDAEATSSDPLAQPIEILERWSEDRVITVLQRCITIRNEENEFGELNFVSCAFIDILNSAWGFGVAKLISGEQKFQQGVMNAWVDSLALSLNPVFQMIKGLGAGTQQVSLSPGKVINETGELKPLLTPSISNEAMNAINESEARSARRVGANGGSNMPSQALRTAEGIQSYTGDVIERLQYFLEIFINMVFVPVLEAFLKVCADKLQPKDINNILSEVDGKEYEGDVLEVYNATCNVDVLAGTKLTARRAAAQIVPLLTQLVAQQPFQDSLTQQGNKFDYAELLDEYIELTGWDINSLIVPMTPEDQQRAQQMNPAVVKAQQDAATQQQKHQDDLENINEKGVTQAGVAVIRQIVKGQESGAEASLAGDVFNPGNS